MTAPTELPGRGPTTVGRPTTGVLAHRRAGVEEDSWTRTPDTDQEAL
ncbi:hypothetical protein ACFXGA_33760 [Actinosynnema sp. NPDC059335]